MLRLPAKLGADAIRFRDNGRRVTRPARHQADREIHARHLFHDINHLEHGETLPVAAIEDEIFAPLAQVVQCIDMRIGKIRDVDVIADARAVARG